MNEICSPQISIIVPVYNVEKYLHRCIDSILSQTFKDFELILVNDGSTDNCGEICNEYKKRDNRVIVIHKENRGLSSARNAGLDIARGNYIGFVDSDDFINCNMYKILLNDILDSNADISICDYFEVQADDIPNVYYSDKKIKLINIEALEKIYNKRGWIYVIAWNKLYNRRLFDEIRFPIGKIHEDEMIAHELLYKAKIITYREDKLYYYYQRSNSIMGEKFNIKKIDIIDAMKRRADFFFNNRLKDLQYKAEQEYLKILFKIYLMKKENQDESIINRLKDVKREYNSIFFRLIKNPYYGIKEKILLGAFYISPKIYNKYINTR